jgi:transcriptional regulator with XRE-family HTH domain/predicted Fe-Mo cluster-binding NifX family protein
MDDNQIHTAEMTPEELLGRRLRSIRINQGYSLRVLAMRSGLNINTLSLVENGKSSPSVSTLQQLSRALNVPITKFFESDPQEKVVVFTPANERPKALIGTTLMQSLGKDLQENAVQPFAVTLEPGSGSGGQSIVHTGHEFVFCLSGSLEYRIGDSDYTLLQGDSLVFQAHIPHCWKNTGPETANILLILFPADKKDEPGGRHFLQDNQKKEINMKIAVISDDGKSISQHFGRAPFYIVYTIEEGKVTNREVREKLGHNQFRNEHQTGEHHENAHEHGQPGHGHDADSHNKHVGMAQSIADCEAIICGGMGMGAYDSMRRLNIKPVVTDSSDAEAAVQAYIEGKLVDHIEKLH